jgi:hypothetical protein
MRFVEHLLEPVNIIPHPKQRLTIVRRRIEIVPDITG